MTADLGDTEDKYLWGLEVRVGEGSREEVGRGVRIQDLN
jgi:hypothetical protein